MKIILTGAAGFIGSCFLSHLNSEGIVDPIIVDTAVSPSQIPNLAGKKFSDYLTREELLQSLESGRLNEVTGIVHLGACADTTEKDRNFLAKNNVEYSRTLAKWCLSNGRFFHYASSASIYGNGQEGYDDSDDTIDAYEPLNPYAESKWLFDRWLISENLTSKVVGYRFFNVFGPNEYHKNNMRSMVCKAYQQIKETGTAQLFASSRPDFEDGSEERDFIYVKDINSVMSYFLAHLDKKGIFNLGTGQARSFKDLVLAVFQAMGKTPKINFFPMPDNLRGQYQYYTQASMDKLQATGYSRPFTRLEDSVTDYVQNYLERNKTL